MKKTYKSSLLALSVLASFTSCSESESLQQANLSKDKITFHATLDNSWKPMSPASSSRAAIAAATEKGPIVVPTPFGKPLYLHPVVQDGIHIWSKEGKPITRSGAPLEDVEHERVAQTRGTMSTKTDLSDYNSFGVTAIYKVGEKNLSLFQEENGAPKIAVATSTNEDKVWEIKDSRWPVGSEVSFHAFAPYSAGSTSPLGFKPDVDNEKTQITYTASTTDIVNQPDLILATAKGSQSDNALGLNFSHALTAVTFAIDKDLADVLGAGKKLTSITLSGIPNEGTYDLAVMKGEGTAAPVWQFAQDGGSNKLGKYTFDLKDQNIVTGKDFALTSDNNTLMMIPQTLPETAKLNFQFDLDGVLQSLTIDMKDQVWQPGKSVIYKLSAKAINTLSNPEVVYPTTWTAVGYPKQSFNNNEAIGLYAVSKDGKVVIPNIKLVKQQDGEGNPIWKTENNQRFLFTTNYKYFAYYPYSNTAPTIDKEATTADAFFKDMIDKWEPAKVQNEQSALVSQDLQVASGVIEPDASKLKFEMAHSMGLAVLTLGTKAASEIAERRIFTTPNYTFHYPDLGDLRSTVQPTTAQYKDSDKKWTGSIKASTNFKSHNPFKVRTNFYIQVIKPSAQGVTFTAYDEVGHPRSNWGYVKPDKSTFKVTSGEVKELEIVPDADFYYFTCRYDCTKRIETFVVTANGNYKMECWGAQGGIAPGAYGGKGSYTSGEILIDANNRKKLFVVVGEQGNNKKGETYNNGINPFTPGSFVYTGGGSTDIRLEDGSGDWKDFTSRKSRIMVAASGSGAAYFGDETYLNPGQGGGGVNGLSGYNKKYTYAISQAAATPGTQTDAGKDGSGNYTTTKKQTGFGIFEKPIYVGQKGYEGGGGGPGNGYYRGGIGNHQTGLIGVGSTGSCFISGYKGCNAIAEKSVETKADGTSGMIHTGLPNHYSGLVFTNSKMIAGCNGGANEASSKMMSPDGNVEYGHSGNGCCIITQLSINDAAHNSSAKRYKRK
mgnify:FL=1